MFTTSSDSLKAAKSYVVEHLSVNALVSDERFNQIFEQIDESVEVWHVLSIMDYDQNMSVVGMFHHDREEKLFHLHVVKHKLGNNHATSGIVVGHYISHFGFPVQKDGNIYELGVTANGEILYELKHEMLNAFAKVASVRRINPTNLQEEHQFVSEISGEDHSLKIAPIIIAYAVAAIAPYVFKAARAIMKWFGTKRTKTVEREIQGKGFRYYSLNAQILRNFGIRSSSFQNYIKYVAGKLTNHSAKHQSQIMDALAVAQYSPLFEWNLADANVDIAKTNQDKFFSLMTNRQEDGKLNFIIVDSDTSYRLTPNFIVYKETKSSMGGGFSSEKRTIEEVPRNVTADELTSIKLFNLMLITKLLHDDLTGKIFAFPTLPNP